MNTILKKCKKEQLLLIFILVVAFCSRFVRLGSWPEGVLPDEAYGAYNAYGLLTEGIDSRGYHNPVYFVAWGSGMNVLYSYLAIPFLKLLGITLFAFRLPQAIFSFLGVIAMYHIGKAFYSKKIGLFLSFILAVNPWSIMNARFGLESNLAPSMFLLALCFFALALQDKNIYLLPAAIFFGLTLYCYALSWIMVPLFLLLSAIYYFKNLKQNKYLLPAIVLLFLIALPLMLFVLINLGFLPEIRTSFLSIPKLAGFRGEELSFANIFASLKDTIRVVLYQYDGKSHTSSPVTGAYYYFTIPFILIGILNQLFRFFKTLYLKERPLDQLMFFWLVSATVICALNANITTIHINLIHIPIIFYSGYGIYILCRQLQNNYLLPTSAAAFGISFVFFLQAYTSTDTGYFFGQNTTEAIHTAKEYNTGQETIYIFEYPTIKYSILLWNELPNITDYYENVVYTGDPSWQEMAYYNGFAYRTDINEVTADGLYIIPKHWEEPFSDLGFDIIEVNEQYSIAR